MQYNKTREDHQIIPRPSDIHDATPILTAPPLSASDQIHSADARKKE
jgi:hypothetical protein